MPSRHTLFLYIIYPVYFKHKKRDGQVTASPNLKIDLFRYSV